MIGVDVTRSLTRPSVYGISVRALGMGLGFVVAVFLARHLAADDLGVYQGLLSVCVILGGLASATAERPVARRISALDGEEADELPGEITTAHMVAGIAMLAIVLVLVVASLLPAVPESVRTSLLISALVAPGVAILSLRQWIALPLQGVAASLGPEQIGQPIVFLAIAGLAAYRAGLGPFEALVIYAVVCWAVWLISSWRSGLLSLLREGSRRVPSRARLRERFDEGRPFVVLTAVGVLPVYATVPIVAALLDVGAAGRLAIAMQITGLVTVPLQIVSLAIMPQCAKLHRYGDTRAIDRMVRTASALSLVLGLVLAAVLLFSLDTILGVLGSSFASTGTMVPALVIGQLVNAMLGPNGPILQMIGMEREVVRVEAVSTALRLLAVAIAASVGSVVGVAWALAAVMILRNVLLSATLYCSAGILTVPMFSDRRAHTH